MLRNRHSLIDSFDVFLSAQSPNHQLDAPEPKRDSWFAAPPRIDACQLPHSCPRDIWTNNEMGNKRTLQAAAANPHHIQCIGEGEPIR